jgi:hypothetical protein
VSDPIRSAMSRRGAVLCRVGADRSPGEPAEQLRIQPGDIVSQVVHARAVAAILHVTFDSDENRCVHGPVFLGREPLELVEELIIV